MKLKDKVLDLLQDNKDQEAVVFTGCRIKSKNFSWSTSGEFETVSDFKEGISNESLKQNMMSLCSLFSRAEVVDCVESLILGNDTLSNKALDLLKTEGLVETIGDKPILKETACLFYLGMLSSSRI
ncbi:hypothetical protein ACRXCV_12075 [Halobacteriovorax sp. GFR7]|uniref:hypothetical protein n=1 Tax=unclassified Halobacteriovorax TaxID=2639665 RepID=UPI003D98ED0E